MCFSKNQFSHLSYQKNITLFILIYEEETKCYCDSGCYFWQSPSLLLWADCGRKNSWAFFSILWFFLLMEFYVFKHIKRLHLLSKILISHSNYQISEISKDNFDILTFCHWLSSIQIVINCILLRVSLFDHLFIFPFFLWMIPYWVPPMYLASVPVFKRDLRNQLLLIRLNWLLCRALDYFKSLL